MTSRQISSGLDLTYAPSIITTQQPSEEPQVRQTSTASTIIADNVSIPTNSSSHATNMPITSQDVDDLNSNALFDGNTFVNPIENSSTSAESSSSQNVDLSNMHTFYQPYPHKFQWTKDHPMKQVIGEPSRPVLTRNQLRSNGDMCMCALTVSTMEPKNVKEAMTDPTWIDLMQEELLQIKRLDAWNDREDIGKLGAKGDIGFSIGYSADSCAYRIYNRRTKKIMETMNVSFDDLSVMAFEQRSSK
nr:hypothetical protein [Tanacetum cinerariifolium]